jgi:hypothetical protein
VEVDDPATSVAEDKQVGQAQEERRQQGESMPEQVMPEAVAAGSAEQSEQEGSAPQLGQAKKMPDEVMPQAVAAGSAEPAEPEDSATQLEQAQEVRHAVAAVDVAASIAVDIAGGPPGTAADGAGPGRSRASLLLFGWKSNLSGFGSLLMYFLTQNNVFNYVY